MISRGKSARMGLLPPPSLLRPLRLPRLTEVVLSTITQSRIPLLKSAWFTVYHCEVCSSSSISRCSPRFPDHVSQKELLEHSRLTYPGWRENQTWQCRVIGCYRDTMKCPTVASVTNEVALVLWKRRDFGIRDREVASYRCHMSTTPPFHCHWFRIDYL